MEQQNTNQAAQAAAREASPSPLQKPWLPGLVVAGAVLAMAFVPANAFGDRKPDFEPGHFITGDETIGTLPILQGPELLDLRRHLAIHQPSLCLEGDLTAIQSSIVSTQGNITARIETADASRGTVRLIFPGNVQIGFDRLMIESSSIRVGVWTPDRENGFDVAWSTRRSVVGGDAPFSELPILSMSHTGALSYAPLFLLAHGASASTSLVAMTTPDLLILRQSH